MSEEFSSGCEGRSGSGGGSTGAPADQDHRPDHKQHRDRTPDDRDEGNPILSLFYGLNKGTTYSFSSDIINDIKFPRIRRYIVYMLSSIYSSNEHANTLVFNLKNKL